MRRPRRLVRPRRRLIAGVCSGIAEYLGWSTVAVRIVYLVGSVLSAAFPGTIVYIVLWILMPNETEDDQQELL